MTTFDDVLDTPRVESTRFMLSHVENSRNPDLNSI